MQCLLWGLELVNYVDEMVEYEEQLNSKESIGKPAPVAQPSDKPTGNEQRPLPSVVVDPKTGRRVIQTGPAQLNSKESIGKPAPVAQLAPTPVENDRIYNELRASYEDNLSQLSKNREALEREKAEKEALNAETQKKERRRAMIAGISDALSSIANLIGVSKGASNQSISSSYSKIADEVEKARLERKNDLKDLNQQLTKLKSDANQAKLAMGIGLANYEQNWKRDREAAERAKEQLRITEQRNREAAERAKEQLRITEQRNREAAERAKEKNAQDAAELAAKIANDKRRTNSQVAKDEAQASFWKRKKDDEGKSKSAKLQFAYYRDGVLKRVNIDKDALKETGNMSISVIRDDIATQYGYKNWNDYIDSQSSRDKRYKDLSESAKKDLGGLSTAFTDDDIDVLVKQFGVRSPRFISLIEAASGGSLDNTNTDDDPLDAYGDNPEEELEILKSLQ